MCSVVNSVSQLGVTISEVKTPFIVPYAPDIRSVCEGTISFQSEDEILFSVLDCFQFLIVLSIWKSSVKFAGKTKIQGFIIRYRQNE